jgi:hypothetical protein
MAITLTPVATDRSYKSWNITALDADTTTTVVHGFAAQPDFGIIQPTTSFATTAQASWGLTIGSTQITVTKQGATGSGGTTPGTTVVARLYIESPHSILSPIGQPSAV